MSAVTKSFTEAGTSAVLSLKPGESATYSVSGTFTGFVFLEKSHSLLSWGVVVAGAVDTGFSGTLKNETPGDLKYRFKAADTDALTVMTGTAVCALTDANTSARKRSLTAFCRVGGTAGWVVGGGTVNTGLLATMAASQTAGKLVVPISGLKPGDTVVGVYLVGQVESAGGEVTLDADLRKHTAAAADVVDASVGAITQLVIAADTILSKTNSYKGGLEEVVSENETFYVLLTGTTAASTDVALQAVVVEVLEA